MLLDDDSDRIDVNDDEELEHDLVGNGDLPPGITVLVTGVTPSRGDNCCCDPRVE